MLSQKPLTTVKECCVSAHSLMNGEAYRIPSLGPLCLVVHDCTVDTLLVDSEHCVEEEGDGLEWWGTSWIPVLGR